MEDKDEGLRCEDVFDSGWEIKTRVSGVGVVLGGALEIKTRVLGAESVARVVLTREWKIKVSRLGC